MNILVTGGAGYIGSFMTKLLLDNGYQVTIVDSLERGYKQALDNRATFIHMDLKDSSRVKSLFTRTFDAIIHFAGYISVEESTKNPKLYFENNVTASENLFKTAIETGKIARFIFSSTAAVYGNPTILPIPEAHSKNPTSPYGETKLAIEELLTQLRKQYSISFASLRYFNAAGASLDGSLGEMHNPETHIIPNAIGAALNHTEFTLFGNDYDTKDGTCIRDYIHVLDLVKAHLLALEKLKTSSEGLFLNVGTGLGYTNLEVIETIKQVTGVDFPVTYKSRRDGDPAVLIADSKKISEELNFKPEYSDLKTIIESAVSWHTNH